MTTHPLAFTAKDFAKRMKLSRRDARRCIEIDMLETSPAQHHLEPMQRVISYASAIAFAVHCGFDPKPLMREE